QADHRALPCPGRLPPGDSRDGSPDRAGRPTRSPAQGLTPPTPARVRTRRWTDRATRTALRRASSSGVHLDPKEGVQVSMSGCQGVRATRPPAARLVRTAARGLLVAMVTLAALGRARAEAPVPSHGMPGSPMPAPGAEMAHDQPFYREGTFHALVGAVLI